MTKVYTVSVFGGDCTTMVGVFSSIAACRIGIRKDYDDSGMAEDGYILRQAAKENTPDYDLVMYAGYGDEPESFMPYESDQCYYVKKYTLDRFIPWGELS